MTIQKLSLLLQIILLRDHNVTMIILQLYAFGIVHVTHKPN